MAFWTYNSDQAFLVCIRFPAPLARGDDKRTYAGYCRRTGIVLQNGGGTHVRSTLTGDTKHLQGRRQNSDRFESSATSSYKNRRQSAFPTAASGVEGTMSVTHLTWSGGLDWRALIPRVTPGRRID